MKTMYEWKFTPDAADVASCRGAFCPCRSGYTYETESQAIWHGKKWLKGSTRTGSITAIEKVYKPINILDY